MLKTNNKVVVGGCSSVYQGNSSTVRFKFEFRRNLFVKSYSYNTFFLFLKKIYIQELLRKISTMQTPTILDKMRLLITFLCCCFFFAI